MVNLVHLAVAILLVVMATAASPRSAKPSELEGQPLLHDLVSQLSKQVERTGALRKSEAGNKKLADELKETVGKLEKESEENDLLTQSRKQYPVTDGGQLHGELPLGDDSTWKRLGQTVELLLPEKFAAHDCSREKGRKVLWVVALFNQRQAGGPTGDKFAAASTVFATLRAHLQGSDPDLRFGAVDCSRWKQLCKAQDVVEGATTTRLYQATRDGMVCTEPGWKSARPETQVALVQWVASEYLHHLSRPAGDCKPVCPACCDAMIRTTLATEPMSLEKFCSGQDPVRPHKRPPIEQFCPQICSSKDGGEDLPCPGGKSFKELQAAESSLAGELSSGINDLMHKMSSMAKGKTERDKVMRETLPEVREIEESQKRIASALSATDELTAEGKMKDPVVSSEAVKEAMEDIARKRSHKPEHKPHHRVRPAAIAKLKAHGPKRAATPKAPKPTVPPGKPLTLKRLQQRQKERATTVKSHNARNKKLGWAPKLFLLVFFCLVAGAVVACGYLVCIWKNGADVHPPRYFKVATSEEQHDPLLTGDNHLAVLDDEEACEISATEMPQTASHEQESPRVSSVYSLTPGPAPQPPPVPSPPGPSSPLGRRAPIEGSGDRLPDAL
eukprot:TRINITY_DN16486_c0_g1_i1.p1 TRINITY_DN16486_c0_g1~~TRINITY_DN16486_c0_g1_i1.p1  ORF type:complete len:616 (-),score=136.17 TRINITY_DN16486_c0_g1_i1:260-2107(-)